jgi:sirohydrochlorin cobaltochelatase
MKAGVVLFAHGARDPRWAAPLEAVAERVRARRPGVEVRLAFLELMTPDLAGAGAALADAGCTHVTVLPLFLGAGGHVRRDLPLLVEALRAAHAGVQWRLEPPVGELPAVIDAMAQAALGHLPCDPSIDPAAEPRAGLTAADPPPQPSR